MYTIMKKTSSGFSLMEVLIALLVLSVGLLGLAALQAVSLKANHSAYQRTQATFLAYDIMDRMRANRNQAIAESYDRNVGATAPSCSGAANLADEDVGCWMSNFVQVLLPAGDASIDCDGNGVCTVIVQWDETRLGGSATDASGTTSFSFTAQI
ncbi:MAG: type IV pilus modification protein PilV [Thiotrichales bacterium]|nr:type IV pilus modification protein PilV [Thiotrichales bacterium]